MIFNFAKNIKFIVPITKAQIYSNKGAPVVK